MHCHACAAGRRGTALRRNSWLDVRRCALQTAVAASLEQSWPCLPPQACIPQCALLTDTHPLLHGLQELRELIARCWSPNPEDRPAFVQLVKEFEVGLVAGWPQGKGRAGALLGSCTVLHCSGHILLQWCGQFHKFHNQSSKVGPQG